MLAVLSVKVTGVNRASHAVITERDILAPRLFSAVIHGAWVAVITGEWPTIGAAGQRVAVHDITRPARAVHRRILAAPIAWVAQVVGAQVGVIAEHRGKGTPRGLRVTGVGGTRVAVLAHDGHLFAGSGLKHAASVHAGGGGLADHRRIEAAYLGHTAVLGAGIQVIGASDDLMGARPEGQKARVDCARVPIIAVVHGVRAELGLRVTQVNRAQVAVDAFLVALAGRRGAISAGHPRVLAAIRGTRIEGAGLAIKAALGRVAAFARLRATDILGARVIIGAERLGDLMGALPCQGVTSIDSARVIVVAIKADRVADRLTTRPV